MLQTVKCRARAGGEILTIENELYQEIKRLQDKKGRRLYWTGPTLMRYFFYPKLEEGFTPHPRDPHFLRTDRQTDR